MSRRIAILSLCTLPMAALPTGCSSEESPAVQRAAGERSPLAETLAKARAKTGERRGRSQTVVQVKVVDDPVDGVVMDPRGYPMAGARVTLFKRLRQWPRRDRVEIESVRSGKGGRFVFAVSRGRDLEVEARARGCATLVRPAPPPGLGTLILQLERGFQVEGSVFLPSGRPAVDCAVYLEPDSGSQMRAVETRTDREGRFVFTGVPADNLRLTARHDQFQPATSEAVTIGRLTTLRFEEPALGLSGRVMSGDKAVEGCTVLVSPRTTNGVFYIPFEGVTNRDGEFLVRGLGQGSYMVELRHDEYSSTQRPLSMNQSRTGLELELQSRVKVRGQLTGAQDVVNTRLSLVSAYGETGSTTINSDGSFEFPGDFSRGMATLELEAGPLSFKLSQSRWVRRALVEGQTELELEVQPASGIKGRVLDSEGKPIPGVEVVAALKIIEDPLNFFSDPNLLVARQRVLAVTDDTGRYTIRGLEPGEVTLGFQKERFGFFTHDAKVKLDVKELPELEQTVKLLPPGSISGRVTRGDTPVPGALVSVGKGLSRVFTGPGGRYTLRGLPAGEHLVRVKFRTLPVAHSEKPVKLAAGQNVSGVDIALKTGRRIRGRVVDSEEIPLASMIVEGQAGTTTKTDEAGRFALDVPLGRTVLFVRAQKFDPIFDRVIVERGANDILVRLRQAPRAAVKAVVKALPRETPVVGMILRLDTDHQRVNINPVSPGQSWVESMRRIMDLQRLNQHHVRGHVERWIETPEGVLDLQNLPAGSYKLTLHTKGYQPFVKNVTLFNGKPVDLGVVKLERGFTVEGIVVDPRGQPVPGAKVVLGRESDLTLAGARTRYVADKRGRFTVEGVGLHLKDLYVAAKGYATQYHSLDLEKDILRGEDDPVRVQLQPGATIRAILVDMDGDPVPFKKVQLNRGYERISEAETDENGVAWFQNLSQGSYHLYLLGKLRSLTNQVVRDTSGARVYSVKLKDVPRQRGGRRQRRR